MKKFPVFLCAVAMLFGLTGLATATLIDFEDLGSPPVASGSNLAQEDGDYAGLDWTRPNDLAHWVVENDGAPFGGSGSSDVWLKGSADTFGVPSGGNFAKITYLDGHLFDFISMDLRGGSFNEWLEEVEIRAKDIDDDEMVARVRLTTDRWVPCTAAALGFDGLDGLKSLTFFGTSSHTEGDNNDRFALDNLNVTIHPIPEPATMLLVGGGLIGLAGLGRKKFFRKS